MEIRILVAEDDELFRELVCDIMEKEGYVPVEARDEIGVLGESINELSNKLSKSMADLQKDVEDKKQLGVYLIQQ